MTITLAEFDVDDTKCLIDYAPGEELLLLTAVGPSGAGKQVKIDIGDLVGCLKRTVTIGDLVVTDGT